MRSSLACSVLLCALLGAADEAFAQAPPDAGDDDFIVVRNTTAELDVLANDSGAQRTIAAVGTPNQGGSVSITDNSRTLTYTPFPNFVGIETFTYTLRNNRGLTDTALVTITVTGGNAAPSFTSSPPLSATTGQLYTYNITATDPNGDPLTIAAPTRPAWLGSFTNNGNGTATLSGTPQQINVGTHSVVVTVSDGIAAPVQQSFQITVVSGNAAPSFTSSPPTSATVGATYTYTVTAADPDGDPTIFAATALPTWLTFNGIDTISGTPQQPNVGTHDVVLTVSDGIAAPAQQAFQITVNPLSSFDVSLAVTATPSPAPVNTSVSWQFTLTNANALLGLDAVAFNAQFSGAPFTFTNAGSCTINGQSVGCTTGPIPAGGNITFTVTGQATQAGDVLVTAVASIAQNDPNLANNTAVATLNVGQSFSSGPALALTGATMRGAAAGDVNGDGFADLVVATGNGSGTRIYMSVPLDPSDANGSEFRTLAASPVSLTDTSSDSQDALLADLDGDGDLDLVVANGVAGAPQANTVFINTLVGGQANFVASGALGNQTSYAVAAADLDANGFSDLVFANGSPNEVFFNQGSGVFTAGPLLGASDSRSVAIADFDGDLHPDVVFANSDGPSHIYRNLGNGTFGSPITVEPAPAVSVRAADFSGDGRPDLIFGRATATAPEIPANTIYVNTSSTGQIRFAGPVVGLGASPTMEVVTANVSLDTEGTIDVVSLNATGTHQIFVGASNSTFTLQPQQFSSPGPTGSAVGDFNNDGRPDLAVAGSAGAHVFLNDGRGNLGIGDTSPPTIQLAGQASVALKVGDAYTDAGATATDDIDGDVTSRITVTSSVNTALVGTYTVAYNATDLAGNKAAPVTRTVTVGTQQASGGGGGGTVGPFLLLLLAGILGGRLNALSRRP